jgi:PBSX family phage terminase large subunit
MDVQYKPVYLLKWQTQVWDDAHRFKVINCGRRTGKSTLALLKMIDLAAKKPGARIWYVAPTYRQAKNIMWQMIGDYVPEAMIAKKNEQELTVVMSNGTVIELKGADNPDSLRGVKIDFIIFDEVAFIVNWGAVWSILRPTLMDSQAECWFISTPNGFNHFKSLADTCNRRSDWEYFHFTVFDNPHIPREEIEQSRSEMTEDSFAQEMLGDFRKMKGLVYKNFNRDIHVQVLTDFQPVFWIRGLDRGFTNPTAVCYVQVNKDGIWYMTHEIYETGLTNSRLSDRLFDMDNELDIREYELSTMDSAQAGDIKELQDLGHDFLPVRKESGETNAEYVRYKIQRLYSRLDIKANGKPNIYIHPRCVNYIREFETYKYKDKKITADMMAELGDISPNEDENPEKANDHGMDSLGDLNVMYQHYYKQSEAKKPWEDKIPGTYVPVHEEEYETGFEDTKNSEEFTWD